jgi:predicted acyltransferase
MSSEVSSSPDGSGGANDPNKQIQAIPGAETSTARSQELDVLRALESNSRRLVSLDALRGFDMFWIIGGDALVKALMAWGGWSFSQDVSRQLDHVDWEGFRFYDLIFPLFLFMAGVALPFSLGKLRERGEPTSRLFWRVFRRMALLFALGLVCNSILQWNPPLRWAGVLQRIAIGSGMAGFLFLLFKPRGLAVVTAMILLGYWALLAFVPPPNGISGDYSKETNLAGYVDRKVLVEYLTINGQNYGKILKPYYGYGDNEGLLSTIPAIATALLGVLAGVWLRHCSSSRRRVIVLALAGAVCLGVGEGWGFAFPIIKNLWTSSFVLVAGGWSLLLLALFHLVIDVWGFRFWAFPFVVIGLNSITIYVAERFISFDKISNFFFGGIVKHIDDIVRFFTLGAVASTYNFGAVLTPFFFLVCEWLFLYYLYRRQLFLRV